MSDTPERNSEPKGFAGFDSLVSNVDKDIADARRIGSTSSAQPPQQTPKPGWAAPAEKSSEEPAGTHGSGRKPARSSGWMLLISIVVFLLIGVWVVKSRPDATPLESSPSQVSLPFDQPVAPETRVPYADRPLATKQEEIWDESKPPVGNNLVLSYPQLRYCVAEDMRLTIMKSMVDAHVDAEVDGFNADVADYNSRCSQFKYKRGSLEAVQSAALAWRESFETQGRLRVEQGRQRVERRRSKPGLPDTVIIPGVKPARSDQTQEPRSDVGSAKDRENLQTCMTGDYPNVCKHQILTPEEAQLVAAAERRANLRTCMTGDYSTLCKHQILTPEEEQLVAVAEHRANLQTCMSGDYPALCKRVMLSPEEVQDVEAAERRVNLATCLSGEYPSLCKRGLLTSAETLQVNAVERRVNFRTCISGDYPSLCRHSLLTPVEAGQVAAAESAAQAR